MTPNNDIKKLCPNCNVECDIQQFAQCSICKLLTHTCNKAFQNAKITEDFIKNAELTGFRFVCTKCMPSLSSFSITVCNIQTQLDFMNDKILTVIKEVKNLKSQQSEFASKTFSVAAIQENRSFSEVVKESTLVLAPKDLALDKDQLKEKVRKSINPEVSQITDLRTTRSNKVILKSGNTDASAFASSVKDKLADDFDVTVYKNDKRQIKLIRFENENYTHEEIATAIINQNVFIDKQHGVKVIKEIKYRDNAKQSILIVELDPKSHKKAVEEGYISIKWRRYKVFDALNVTRCYKCSRLGHTAKICNSKTPVCPKCAEHHKVDECQSNETKCINCLEANLKFNINVCPNHPSFSQQCPTMLNRLSKLQRAIDRNI